MASAKSNTSKGSERQIRIIVEGYKSIRNEQMIELRPLTVFAGPNSSGKSSIMQPLLLLKQTFDATFDSGRYLASGPNVRFTSASQLFSKNKKYFRLGAELNGKRVVCSYIKGAGKSIAIFHKWSTVIRFMNENAPTPKRVVKKPEIAVVPTNCSLASP